MENLSNEEFVVELKERLKYLEKSDALLLTVRDIFIRNIAKFNINFFCAGTATRTRFFGPRSDLSQICDITDNIYWYSMRLSAIFIGNCVIIIRNVHVSCNSNVFYYVVQFEGFVFEVRRHTLCVTICWPYGIFGTFDWRIWGALCGTVHLGIGEILWKAWAATAIEIQTGFSVSTLILSLKYDKRFSLLSLSSFCLISIVAANGFDAIQDEILDLIAKHEDSLRRESGAEPIHEKLIVALNCEYAEWIRNRLAQNVNKYVSMRFWLRFVRNSIMTFPFAF